MKAKPKTGKSRYDVPTAACRRVYERAMRGRSRRAAIEAFCAMCMGWDRQAVPGCTAPACPLYPYRLTPGQKHTPESTIDGQGATQKASGVLSHA